MPRIPQSLVLEGPAATSAEARDVASQFVAHMCPWAETEAVVLVVAELVANAARHTRGPWRLSLWAHLGELRIGVEDSSSDPPVGRAPDLAGGGGFGWHLVHRLAHHVLVIGLPQGKRVEARWEAPHRGGEPVRRP
ncbi:ATP-binding protein [Streptomyces sp. NPDC007088]|uniref:ATP-binding protein n=1 Tax=Streptomyces sp. NPDC007088 TaxID=3364773 RepID=UPI0036C202B4